MKFIDLFAGLGGFHLALAPLGHKCVFACEIDSELNRLYQANFGMRAAGDINDVRLKEIPDHDILCAGFPCQPFSHAGKQEGLNCGKNGNLIDNIIRILRAKRPAFFILENVPNLLSHNKGSTWADILKALSGLRYHVEHRMLSPTSFGIPQRRKRMFILGSQKEADIQWPEESPPKGRPLKKILDKTSFHSETID